MSSKFSHQNNFTNFINSFTFIFENHCLYLFSKTKKNVFFSKITVYNFFGKKINDLFLFSKITVYIKFLEKKSFFPGKRSNFKDDWSTEINTKCYK